MPPPKTTRGQGSGFASGSASTSTSRSSPMSNTFGNNVPMSERQQMALLIQMTSSTSDSTRPHSKKSEHKKVDGADMDDSNLNEKPDSQDSTRITNTGAPTSTSNVASSSEKANAEYKEGEDSSNNDKQDTAESNARAADKSSSNECKRSFNDMLDEEDYDDNDDVKKKKRKDSENTKETKTSTGHRMPARMEKSLKQNAVSKSSPTALKSGSAANAAASTTGSSAAASSTVSDAESSNQPPQKTQQQSENEADDEEMRVSSDSMYSGGLKVPPLKIVIPQQNTVDSEGNVSRGKVNTSRNASLSYPYVVTSSNEAGERDANAQMNSPNESPLKVSGSSAIDEKSNKLTAEEKNLHRVLRSSHRGGGAVERSSNNSSPQMQSSSPSPASSNANEAANEGKASSPAPHAQSTTFEQENIVNLPSPSTSSTSSSKEVHTSSSTNVELHPRKRKIRSKNEETTSKASSSNNSQNTTNTNAEATSVAENHPHDFPFTNCFQMYLNIRKQIEKKWKNMFPVKPRAPQGYNEYLINKRTYLLKSNPNKELDITVPSTVAAKMKEIFIIQQQERNELLQRHTVEREKLCLNVEQEIIRVHTKAARYTSSQSVPLSVCSLLKDDEVYNVILPEQEDKDKSARYRFNGRHLLSWLQDVDDKWEKIKESMLLRHHNEAESLHAVQLMDWEIALKKYELCDFKSQLVDIDKTHVPIVCVDDFDLLPA